jgi:hypothetical protein
LVVQCRDGSRDARAGHKQSIGGWSACVASRLATK